MKSKKGEDQEYLNQFRDKTVGELLDILCVEASKLKTMMKDFIDKATKNGKN